MNYLIEIATFIHVIGVSLGFGGALVGDTLFFSSIHDKKFTFQEFRFMKLVGKVVWLGLIILLISGVGLVFLKPELLQSPKFLLKMVVVLIIAINGGLLHRFHFSKIEQNLNVPVYASVYFTKYGKWLTAQGAISVVSWFSAAFLGSLPMAPAGFPFLLGCYLIILIMAVLISFVISKHLFRA